MKKNKLLLHVCCAPCASAVLEKLADTYQLTLLYFNPNIQPAAEWQKRLAQFAKLTGRFQFELLAPDYAPQEWLALAAGLRQEPEGGRRCQVCFNYRLEYSARIAGTKGLAAFASALSISPHKNLEQINLAGRTAARKHAVSFLEFDFRGLYRRSVALSREQELYRQHYCGCAYAQN